MHHWKPAPPSGAPERVKQRSVTSASRSAPAAAQWPRLEDLPLTCDPYLTWAVASKWRGEARAIQDSEFRTGKQQIRVLLRAKSNGDLKKIAQKKGVQIAPIYLGASTETEPAAFASARFATATLHPSCLMTLLGQSHRVEFELAAAVRDQGGELKGDAKGYFGQQSDLDLSAARELVKLKPVEADKGLNSKDQQLKGGTLVVFDYGCPFLRDQFMDEAGSSTRIAALWHQENFLAEVPWQVPVSMDRGRVLIRAKINQLIKHARHPACSGDEAAVYSRINYLIDYAHPRRRVFTSTHGAHVLDVAGGRPDPLNPDQAPDEASRANLVFVQMPEDTAGDSSAASLGACLLDGLRYALQLASPTAPLVVNVSFGTTAGPHNGSSMIEQAMDELLDLRPKNFAVVLAAGNSRQLGLHCKRTVFAAHSALFRLNVMAGDRTDTFVEFWYAQPHLGSIKFRARLPNGDWSPWVAADAGVDLRDETGEEVVASLIHRRQVPNGNLSMMLLALRPTETPADDDGPLATPGRWEIEVRMEDQENVAEKLKAVEVNAWIKRDDSRPYGGRVQSYFEGLDRCDPEDTLNGLATGSHTLVASGFRWSDGMVVDYASRGPRRPEDQWPLVYGLCEWDSVDAGIRASAVRSGETRLMNGTSVAAPVVARQVLNLMSQAGKSGLDRSELWAGLENLAQQRGSVLRVGQHPVADQANPTE